jgi:hypothetical protein
VSLGSFARIALLFLIAANASALPAAAQPVDRIDAVVGAIVRGEMQKQHIPGVALAVLRNGSIVLEQGHGLANVESNIPVRNDTAFSIGSLSKQFIVCPQLSARRPHPLAAHHNPSPADPYFRNYPGSSGVRSRQDSA